MRTFCYGASVVKRSASFSKFLGILGVSALAAVLLFEPAVAQATKHHHAAPAQPADPNAPKKHHKAWPIPALGKSASGDPEVLFTFDDGPGGDRTNSVLDTLAAHNVKAIFFLVGNRITGGSKTKIHTQIQRMLDEGHAVGNHTVNHKNLCLKSSADKVDKEIDDNQHLLEDQTHMSIVFFRAPYGVRCPQLEDALDARHLGHIHWDIDAQEWKTHDTVRTRDYIIKEIGHLADGERSVVLIHDIHEETAQALPGILDFVDQENVRRRAEGKRPIRMIGPVDIALERLAPGVATAGQEAATTVGAAGPNLVRRFLGPLEGLGPLARI